MAMILAVRERAAERRHGAGLAGPDAVDDELVAALGAGVLMAIAAHGREHGGAVDVQIVPQEFDEDATAPRRPRRQKARRNRHYGRRHATGIAIHQPL